MTMMTMMMTAHDGRVRGAGLPREQGAYSGVLRAVVLQAEEPAHVRPALPAAGHHQRDDPTLSNMPASHLFRFVRHFLQQMTGFIFLYSSRWKFLLL